MPHIKLPAGLPGIIGLLEYRPAVAKPLNDLTDILLTSDSTLSRGERELIAAYVSSLNECVFCVNSHGAFAGAQIPGGDAVVEAVRVDYTRADISPKMKSLLAIAKLVNESGLKVTAASIATAREQGATDLEIHDTVLIASVFCMFNRYIDGLAAWSPKDPQSYAPMAQKVVEHGYEFARSKPVR